MTDKDITHDPIYQDLDRQDRFYRENSRDEEITRKVGWDERFETGEGPR